MEQHLHTFTYSLTLGCNYLRNGIFWNSVELDRVRKQ